MKDDNTTTHQSHPVSNCTVTHQDHQAGLDDLKQRHYTFYQTLSNLIDEKDKD